MKKKSSSGSLSWKVALPVAAVVVVVAGAGIAFANGLTGGAPLTASVFSSIVSSVVTSTSPATTASHHISYVGADKGQYGAVVNVFPEGKPPAVTITMESSKSELARLARAGKVPAYITYDVYPAMIGANNTGAHNVAPIFSSSAKTSMSVKGTSLTAKLPLDFSTHLFPNYYYTVALKITAADSSFVVTDYLYILGDNSEAQCQTKG